MTFTQLKSNYFIQIEKLRTKRPKERDMNKDIREKKHQWLTGMYKYVLLLMKCLFKQNEDYSTQ